MKIRKKAYLFPLPLRIISLIFICVFVANSSQASIPLTERQVLLDLFKSTHGQTWINNTGWGGAVGSECSWRGITCNESKTRVTRVMLNGNNLTGVLPELKGLTELQELHLIGNELTGSLPTLTGLPSLTWLVANHNHFTGSIPELTGLTKLQVFQVTYNQLSGTVPSLTGLVALELFNAGGNQLEGPIPELSGLARLGVFELGNNRLSGSIPKLTGLSNLGSFDVASNQLSGTIPALIGLTKLQNFIVSNNQLSGPIPEFTGLTNLRIFAADHNQLTGSIPSLTSTSLASFRVNNNQLTGATPSLDSLTNLALFDVSYNQLTGPIPAPPLPNEFGNLGGRSSRLCPNKLTYPSPDPSIDVLWNSITNTTPWWTACTADALIAPNTKMGGLYYDPNREGEGWQLTFGTSNSQPTLVAAWYTYENGRQLWLMGGASLDPVNTSVTLPLFSTNGANFGPAFKSSDVTKTAWGNAILQWHDCNTLHIRYSRNDGLSETLNLTRFFYNAQDAACH